MATIMSNIWKTVGYILVIALLLSLPPKTSCRDPTISPSGECIHYVGDMVRVTCTGSHDYSTVHWMLNNNTRYDHSQPDIQITTINHVSFIIINNISQEYNNTAIRFEGSYTNGESFSNVEVTILLQGILQSVTNLSADVNIDKIVNISWTAPYTIDVPSTDTDIRYCMDIYDTSAVEPTLKYSKCEINQTYHQCAYYPMLIACAEYQVKVIAVNKVGNSTAASHQVGVKALNFNSYKVVPTEEFNKIVHVNSSTEVCYSKGEVIADGVSVLLSGENNGNIITFELIDNNHYQDVVININFDYKVTESLGRIDTYDVMEIEVKNTSTILSQFLPGTRAIGVLCLVMYSEKVNGSINFKKSQFYAVRRNLDENELILNLTEGSLSKGFYYIWAYDIEYDGNIQSFGFPAAESSVNIIEGSDENNLIQANQKCLVVAIKKGITVNCTCTGTIQVLLQRTDADFDTIKNISAKNTSCGVPAVFNNQQNGSYWTTVFDTLEMEVYFVGEINLMFSASYHTPTEMTMLNDDAMILYSVIPVVGGIIILLAIVTLVMILYSKNKMLMMENDISMWERLQFVCCFKRKKWYDTHNRKSETISHGDEEGFRNCISYEPTSVMQYGNQHICTGDAMKDDNVTENNQEAVLPECKDNINEEENGTENSPDITPTAGSNDLSDGTKKERNETVDNPETMPPLCTDELSGEIKEEENETMNNSETVLTAAGSDELSGGTKEEKNETTREKYADVTFLPSPNSLPVMQVHRVNYTTVLTPGSCPNTNKSIDQDMPVQNNDYAFLELPSQERDDIVPIHDGSVDRENLNMLAVEPSNYITPGFLHSFKNNFEMEMLSSDLTFADNDYTEDSCEEENIEPVVPSEHPTLANCDCIDDCRDEENIEPVVPSEHGQDSLTKFTTENIVYCLKLECGESTHSLDETKVKKYCQVPEKLANYKVLTIKKRMDYDDLGKILNIPVLQRAKDIPIQEAITEDLSPFKKLPKDEVAVLIEPLKNEKWTQSLHIQLVRAFYSRRFYERLG